MSEEQGKRYIEGVIEVKTEPEDILPPSSMAGGGGEMIEVKKEPEDTLSPMHAMSVSGGEETESNARDAVFETIHIKMEVEDQYPNETPCMFVRKISNQLIGGHSGDTIKDQLVGGHSGDINKDQLVGGLSGDVNKDIRTEKDNSSVNIEKVKPVWIHVHNKKQSETIPGDIETLRKSYHGYQEETSYNKYKEREPKKVNQFADFDVAVDPANIIQGEEDRESDLDWIPDDGEPHRTMSLSIILKKEPTHFLVKYLKDKETQVRSKDFIKFDGKVTVSGQYKVQRNRVDQMASAVILGAGTESEMKTLQKARLIEQEFSQPTNRKRTSHASAKFPSKRKKKLASAINRFKTSHTMKTATQTTATTSRPLSTPPAIENALTITLLPLSVPTGTCNQTASTKTRASPTATQTGPAITQAVPTTTQTATETQTVSTTPLLQLSTPTKTQSASSTTPLLPRSTPSTTQTAPTKTQTAPITVQREPVETQSALTTNLPLPTAMQTTSTSTMQISSIPSDQCTLQMNSKLTTVPALSCFDSINSINDNYHKACQCKCEATTQKKLEALNRKIYAIQKNQIEIKNMVALLLQRTNTATFTVPTVQLGTSTPTSSQKNVCPEITSSDPFADIPEQFRLPLNVLEREKGTATNPGHFACRLMVHLYPELFGPDNLRLQFSYNGGGKLNKKELDRDRKVFLQRYVLYYHPDVKDPQIYKSIVITKVNEILRRPVRQ